MDYKDINKYNNLPIVFGNGDDFYLFYKDLKNLNFPLETIKSFYYFDSGRWDLILRSEKVIKLPIQDYVSSLEDFMGSKEDKNFNKNEIFDYRIKNQIILN